MSHRIPLSVELPCKITPFSLFVRKREGRRKEDPNTCTRNSCRDARRRSGASGNHVKRPGIVRGTSRVARHASRLVAVSYFTRPLCEFKHGSAVARTRGSGIPWEKLAKRRRPSTWWAHPRLTSVCWDSSPSGFAGFSFGLGFSSGFLPVSSSFFATSSVVVNFLPLAFFRSFLAKKSSRSAMATRDGVRITRRGATRGGKICDVQASASTGAPRTRLITDWSWHPPWPSTWACLRRKSTAATRESSARLNVIECRDRRASCRLSRRLARKGEKTREKLLSRRRWYFT